MGNMVVFEGLVVRWNSKMREGTGTCKFGWAWVRCCLWMMTVGSGLSAIDRGRKSRAIDLANLYIRRKLSSWTAPPESVLDVLLTCLGSRSVFLDITLGRCLVSIDAPVEASSFQANTGPVGRWDHFLLGRFQLSAVAVIRPYCALGDIDAAFQVHGRVIFVGASRRHRAAATY